jgi:hypothetical protein
MGLIIEFNKPRIELKKGKKKFMNNLGCNWEHDWKEN